MKDEQWRMLTGNAFPVRDKIKSLGGRWCKKRIGYEVPICEFSKAQSIIDIYAKEHPDETAPYYVEPSCEPIGHGY